MHDHSRSDWPRHRAAAKAALAVPVIALGAAFLAAGCGTASSPHAAASAPATGPPRATVQSQSVRMVHLTAFQSAPLPLASTYGTTPTAPRDPAPFAAESGTVAHPTTTQVIYTRPGGPAVAVLPVTELGSPTWVPVVQSQPGWYRILLPTRPDRSTGWIHAGAGLQTAHTPYQVVISLSTYRLTVLDAGHSLGTWTVAEGAVGTSTPTGRTFVLASLAPAKPTYSPLILPLGTHSGTLTTYGGGPGTVALHGWPDAAVFGQAVSHGCVRVPPAALRALSRVPLGSPVIITS